MARFKFGICLLVAAFAFLVLSANGNTSSPTVYELMPDGSSTTCEAIYEQMVPALWGRQEDVADRLVANAIQEECLKFANAIDKANLMAVAVSFGHPRIIKRLAAYDAALIYEKDVRGNSPLFTAAGMGAYRSVEMLLSLDDRVDVTDAIIIGLHDPIAHPTVYLLANHNETWLDTEKSQVRVFQAVLNTGSVSIMQYLISKGLRTNFRDSEDFPMIVHVFAHPVPEQGREMWELLQNRGVNTDQLLCKVKANWAAGKSSKGAPEWLVREVQGLDSDSCSQD